MMHHSLWDNQWYTQLHIMHVWNKPFIHTVLCTNRWSARLRICARSAAHSVSCLQSLHIFQKDKCSNSWHLYCVWIASRNKPTGPRFHKNCGCLHRHHPRPSHCPSHWKLPYSVFAHAVRGLWNEEDPLRACLCVSVLLCVVRSVCMRKCIRMHLSNIISRTCALNENEDFGAYFAWRVFTSASQQDLIKWRPAKWTSSESLLVFCSKGPTANADEAVAAKQASGVCWAGKKHGFLLLLHGPTLAFYKVEACREGFEGSLPKSVPAMKIRVRFCITRKVSMLSSAQFSAVRKIHASLQACCLVCGFVVHFRERKTHQTLCKWCKR